MSLRNRFLTVGFFLLGALAASPVFSHVYQFRVIDADTGFTFYETDFIDLLMGNPPPYRAGDSMRIRVEAQDQAGDIVQTFNRDVRVELRAQLGPNLGEPLHQVTTLIIDRSDFVDGVAEVDFTPRYAGTGMMRFWVTDYNIVTDDASSPDPSQPIYFPVHPAGFEVTYVGGNRPLDAHPIIQNREIFARVRALNADGTTATGWDGDVELEAPNNSLSWSVSLRGGVSDYSHGAPQTLPLSFDIDGQEQILALAYGTDPSDPLNWDPASPLFTVVEPGTNQSALNLNLVDLQGGEPYPGREQTVRYQLENPESPDGEDPDAGGTDGDIDIVFELRDPSQNNLVILRWFEQFTGSIPAGENSGAFPLESTFLLPQNLLGSTTYELRFRPLNPELDWETIDIEIDTMPDLRILRMDYVPGEYRGGEGVRFHLTFWNAFQADGQPASAVPDDQPYRLQLHLSADGLYGNEDDFLVWERDFAGNRRGNRLLPGQVIDVVGDIMLPNNFDGTYNLLARINSGGGRDGEGFEPEFRDPERNGNNTTFPRDSEKITILPRQATETFRVSVTSEAGSSNGDGDGDSDGEDGNQHVAGASNGHSDNAVVSADGRFVAFESRGALAGETNGNRNIFVRNIEGQNTILASVGIGGAAASGNSGNPSISDDGRYVVFQSSANNLVPGDTNTYTDIFIRDIQRDTTQRLSINPETKEQGNHGSQLPRISGDARFVVFESSASNLTADSGLVTGRMQIYLYDRQENELQLVSGLPAAGGNLAAGVFPSTRPAISEDGSYVVFVTSDREILGLPPVGPEPFPQVVRWERGTRTFALVTTPESHHELADNISGYPAISGDGRYVAFASRAQNLTEHFDLFLNPSGDTYWVGIPHVFRARLSASGQVEEMIRMNAWDGDEPNYRRASFVPPLGSYEPTLSRDGQLLSFTSESDNLLPRMEVRNVDRTPLFSGNVFGYIDANRSADVYLYDLADPLEPAIQRASVSSFGYGTTIIYPEAGYVLQTPVASRRPAISPDGRFVAFTSATKGRYGLIFGDTNYIYAATNGNYSDIYVFDLKRGLSQPSYAPEVELLLPEGIEVVAGSEVTLIADATSEFRGIDFVEFYANNQLIGTAAEPVVANTGRFVIVWEAPHTGTGNNDGQPYEIIARAVDSHGVRSNVSDKNRSIIVVTPFTGSMAPVIDLLHPIDGDILTSASKIRLAANASDPSGELEGVQFYVNGKAYGAEVILDPSLASATYPFSIEWTPSAPGIYTIVAVARNSSDNRVMSQAATVRATQGASPPQIVLSYEAPDGLTLGGEVLFRAHVAPGVGRMIESVTFHLNGMEFWVDTTAPYTAYFVLDGVGVYQFTAVALDNAGNKTVSNVISLNTPGIVNPGDPSNNIGFVPQMYLDLLGRAPRPFELQTFVRDLETGARTRGEVIAKIMTEPEFRSRLWVIVTYLTVLGEYPTPDQMSDGVAILAGIEDDDEENVELPGGDNVIPSLLDFPAGLPFLVWDILRSDEFWIKFSNRGYDLHSFDLLDIVWLQNLGRSWTYSQKWQEQSLITLLGRYFYLSNLVAEAVPAFQLQAQLASLVVLLLERQPEHFEVMDLRNRFGWNIAAAADWVVSRDAFVERFDGEIAASYLGYRFVDEDSYLGAWDPVSAMYVKPSEWFGLFNDTHFNYPMRKGWVRHLEHGWLYIVGRSENQNMWIWDHIQSDWLWTNPAIYGPKVGVSSVDPQRILFSNNRQKWIQIGPNGTPNSRWIRVHDTAWGPWIPVQPK